ncbi:hypothetical protein N8I71_13855 [Roseibacterium sp. SDUM158016]|uniref:sugar-transfer associated ATP-grasp domain-containing protein n=1 Tax=Roseicyclus sediminis TaxID=2980997 RepID=UPI0021D2015B|nr:sugar-transfer associated ATP-grasp domain-containing protein [Roseibacterium sp. SDUM158016]MCU4653925.1 hypothetical protein [Roseibacterium sp. SDUM158016]
MSRKVLRFSPEAVRLHGRERNGSLAVWYTALRYNHSPVDVVQFDMLAPDARPDAWINDRETTLIWGFLNSNGPRQLLNDKVKFAEFCNTHGLPTPHILEHWEGGAQKIAISEPWPDNIVEKPARGARGRAVIRWTKIGDGYTDGTSVVSRKAIVNHLAEVSRTEARILQPEVKQHHAIVQSGILGAPVARIMTGRWPSGSVKLLGAYLSLPEPGQFASNIGHGYELPIDLSDGALSPSRAFWPSASIAPPNLPSIVPDWQRACEITRAAHTALPGRMVAVGWDVIFSEDGPIILEGNHTIGLYKLQRSTQLPAADTLLGDLLDVWLSEQG